MICNKPSYVGDKKCIRYWGEHEELRDMLKVGDIVTLVWQNDDKSESIKITGTLIEYDDDIALVTVGEEKTITPSLGVASSHLESTRSRTSNAPWGTCCRTHPAHGSTRTKTRGSWTTTSTRYASAMTANGRLPDGENPHLNTRNTPHSKKSTSKSPRRNNHEPK